MVGPGRPTHTRTYLYICAGNAAMMQKQGQTLHGETANNGFLFSRRRQSNAHDSKRQGPSFFFICLRRLDKARPANRIQRRAVT